MITDQSSYYDFDIKDGKWVYRFKNSNNWREVENQDLVKKLIQIAVTMPEYKNVPGLLAQANYYNDPVGHVLTWMPTLKASYVLGEEILKKAEEGKLAAPKKQDNKKLLPMITTFEDLRTLDKEYSKGSNADIINNWYTRNKNGLFYIIDDKDNETLSVYKDGLLVKSFPAIHGKNKRGGGNTERKVLMKYYMPLQMI